MHILLIIYIITTSVSGEIFDIPKTTIQNMKKQGSYKTNCPVSYKDRSKQS